MKKKIKKIEYKKVDKKISSAYIIAGSIVIVILSIISITAIQSSNEKYIVQNGDVELTELTTAFMVKGESSIPKEVGKVLVPIIAEGAKVAKGNIVATYKGEEFENYEQTLEAMDKEILILMQDLPPVYSSDVDTIESQIYSLVKSAIGETSYIEMQDYKQTINRNINKRAKIMGELSPEGAAIRELIQKRNEYEESAKKSNDNIIATMAGIVSYKTDGLEDKIKTSDIGKITYKELKNITEKKETSNNNIKIVNNYLAYIVAKVDLNNLEYITLNKKYKLRLVEDVATEFVAELIKYEKSEDSIEVVFKIENGIEKLVSVRETDVEIVWWTTTGLFVPVSSINKYENKDIAYVTVLKYGEYSKIPIKIYRQNEKHAIVDNYTNSEIKELGIKRDYQLKIYDTLLVKIDN